MFTCYISTVSTKRTARPKSSTRRKHSNSIKAAPALNVQPRCSLCWLTEHRWEEVCSPLPLCCTFDMSPWDKWTAQLEGQSKWCGCSQWTAGMRRREAARWQSCQLHRSSSSFLPLQAPGGQATHSFLNPGAISRQTCFSVSIQGESSRLRGELLNLMVFLKETSTLSDEFGP